MPIKVLLKTHVDIAGNRVPQYLWKEECVIIDYPNEHETTVMYSNNCIYTFKNEDIIKI